MCENIQKFSITFFLVCDFSHICDRCAKKRIFGCIFLNNMCLIKLRCSSSVECDL